MTCDQAQQHLNDFIDGLLPAEERSRIESHLADCEGCRTELAELRDLLDTAAGLATGITPGRDLWPAVNARITAPARLPRFSRLRPALAAAALVIIVAAASLTLPRAIERGLESITGMTTEWHLGQLTAAAMERQYLGAIEELSWVVAERRGTVPESALKLIDSNLKVLDEAIEESRTALMQNPSDRELQSMLSTVYQRKVELLQWTAHITTSNE
jgi:anti-sigma factor RsiW